MDLKSMKNAGGFYLFYRWGNCHSVRLLWLWLKANLLNQTSVLKFIIFLLPCILKFSLHLMGLIFSSVWVLILWRYFMAISGAIEFSPWSRNGSGFFENSWGQPWIASKTLCGVRFSMCILVLSFLWSSRFFVFFFFKQLWTTVTSDIDYFHWFCIDVFLTNTFLWRNQL